MITQNVSIKFDYTIKGVPDTVLSVIHSKLKEFEKSTNRLTKNNIRSYYLASKKEIYNTLQALGYFKATIQSHLENNNNHYSATYTIKLGSALTITHLNIQLIGDGKQDNLLQQLVNKLNEKKGCLMSTENYQILKRELYRIMIAEGYLDAQWKEHTVIIDPVKYTATINLSMETGHQYQTGPITFRQKLFSAAFLKHYVTFKEKSPYRLQDLQALQATLKNTGYFQKATIKIPSHPTHHEIPINIDLVPVPKHYHAIRIGYSTNVGFRIKAEKSIRYLNDRGHQATLMGEYSFTHPITLLGVYSIPGVLAASQQYHIQLGYNQHYVADTPTKVGTFGLFSVRQYPAWNLTSFLKYHYEAFPENSASHIDDYAHLFIPGFIAYVSQINWLEGMHNYEIHLHTQAASRAFLSTIDLFRTEYKLNYFGEYSNYLHWWKQYSYLLLRMRLGYTFIPSLQKKLPSFGLYAGGLQYPRGHQEYQASNALFSCTLEYRHCLGNLLYLNFFTDIHPQVNNNHLHLTNSSGIGLALWTPMIGIAEVSLVYKNSHLPKKAHSWRVIVRMSDEL